ncbi:TonB-dependent receptor [Ferrimonas pelagia]|uniref:TonB-dependent receptor n=1 Tax=Ferrimonas pelagia TaxID=1177826 RepID=A0ABP9EGQ6_9GAMM
MKSVNLPTRSSIALAVVAGLLASHASADDKVAFSLGEIIVSEDSGVRDIAINNVMTAETISLIGAKTAADALDYIPGLHVAQSSRGERFVTMQGFEQDRLLVLLDGVPYYQTNSGALDLNQLPASIIAKIEVTKGASSVLYGPNGMGGVINIITRTGQEGFSGEVSASAGQYGQNFESASLSWGQNGFSVFASFEHQGRDAYRLSSDYVPETSINRVFYGDLANEVIIEEGGKRDNSHLESINAWIRAGYSDDRTDAYISVFSLDTERGRPHNTRSNRVFEDFSSFAEVPEYKDQGVDINLSHRVTDALTLRALTYYHMHRDTYRSFSGPDHAEVLAESSFHDYTIGTALFADLALADWNTLSTSFNYKNDVHKKNNNAFVAPDESYDWVYSELETFSVATENTSQLGNLTLVAGLAWHHQRVVKDQDEAANDDDSSNTLDPMIGASYALFDGSRMYGSIAQKTRFATLDEMYDRAIGKVHDLDPERSLSYTMGWQKDLNSNWLNHVDMGLFYHDVKDKIASGYDATVDDEIYGNIGSAEYYGVELALHSQLTDTLDLSVDYAYTHARNTSEDRESDFLRDVPQNSVSAILQWTDPYFNIQSNVRMRYKNNVLIKDYDSTTKDSNVWEDRMLTFDMGVRKDFLHQQLTVYANVYNLMDEFFYEGYGQPNWGRYFDIGFTYRF